MVFALGIEHKFYQTRNKTYYDGHTYTDSLFKSEADEVNRKIYSNLKFE